MSFSITDHKVQRTETRTPGYAAPQCPVCAGPLDYDDQEYIGTHTLTFTYSCDPCGRMVYHQYMLDAVTSVEVS